MSVCVTTLQLTDVLLMLTLVSVDKSCVQIKRIMSVVSFRGEGVLVLKDTWSIHQNTSTFDCTFLDFATSAPCLLAPKWARNHNPFYTLWWKWNLEDVHKNPVRQMKWAGYERDGGDWKACISRVNKGKRQSERQANVPGVFADTRETMMIRRGKLTGFKSVFALV